MKAVILARVSTKEQEDGHSLPAQQARLLEYAKRKHLIVIRTYQIVESSTRGKRKEFTEMINFCKTQDETIAIVADAVDRVQRSFKESVLLDDLIRQEKIELHFFREGMIIGKKSSSTDIMRWDFSVMGAKAYVLQLSENVRRSLDYKLKNGERIGVAACGYENYVDKTGKHSVRKKEPYATYIQQLFKIYSVGGTSMTELSKIANKMGLRTYSGNHLTVSSVQHILDNPFYYGEMFTKGKLIKHVYEPLITKALWDKCQRQRRLQTSKPFKVGEIDFLYRGVFTDYNTHNICSCEIKKGKYVYVVCHKANKTRVYVPEYKIDKRINQLLKQISVSNQMVQAFKEYVTKNKKNEIDYINTESERLQTELRTVNKRLDNLLEMRIDHEIDKDEYEDRRADYMLEKSHIEDDIKALGQTNDGFNETVLKLLNMLVNVGTLYNTCTTTTDKQKLLHFIFKKLCLNEGYISYILNIPFCYMADNFIPKTEGETYRVTGNCELQQYQGLDGNFEGIFKGSQKPSCELNFSLKKQEVRQENLTSVQSGWREDPLNEQNSLINYTLYLEHRSEILVMKEQIHIIKKLMKAA